MLYALSSEKEISTTDCTEFCVYFIKMNKDILQNALY